MPFPTKDAQGTMPERPCSASTVRAEDGPGEPTEGVGKENGKLKRLVAELALDKQILKDIAGNF
jgi:hypothetical protein